MPLVRRDERQEPGAFFDHGLALLLGHGVEEFDLKRGAGAYALRVQRRL